MENREILIANTKTQTRSKITTDATTLGELKAALDASNIDYRDMTFTEGISKTQLLDDDTQLPQNLMYKGKATNNLVILLTNTTKKIASGIYTGDRKACYSIIKEQNLQDDVKEYFGRNFTQVPTTDLQSFIEDRTGVSSDNNDKDGDRGADAGTDENEALPTKDRKNEIVKAVLKLITVLWDEEVIEDKEVMDIAAALSTTCAVAKKMEDNHTESVSTSDGTIDDDDIDNMLNDLSL